MENVGFQQVQYNPTFGNVKKVQQNQTQSSPIEQKEDGDKKLWGTLAGLGAIAIVGVAATTALIKNKKVDMNEISEGLQEGIAKFKNGKTVTGVVEDSANGITRQFKDGQLIFKKEVVKNGDETFEVISKYNKDGVKTSRKIAGHNVKLDDKGHALYADASRTKVQINDKQYVDLTTGKTADITDGMKFEAQPKVKSADAPKADAPKADAPTAEAPKADAPTAEAPKAETPKAEAPDAEIKLGNPAEDSAKFFETKYSNFTLEQMQQAEHRATAKKANLTSELEDLVKLRDDLQNTVENGRRKARKKALKSLVDVNKQIDEKSAQWYKADDAIEKIREYKKSHVFM